MVKWAKIAFDQLQENEIQEYFDILALNQDQVTQSIESWKRITSQISLTQIAPYPPKSVNTYGYTFFKAKTLQYHISGNY